MLYHNAHRVGRQPLAANGELRVEGGVRRLGRPQDTQFVHPVHRKFERTVEGRAGALAEGLLILDKHVPALVLGREDEVAVLRRRLYAEGDPVPVLVYRNELLHAVGLGPDSRCVEITDHRVLTEYHLIYHLVIYHLVIWQLYIRIGIGDALGGIPDTEGDRLVLVGIGGIGAVDDQGLVRRAAYLLRCSHAAALAADEGSHHALGVLHEDTAEVNLSDDGHRVVVLGRVHGPVRRLAAHFHDDTERFEDALVALHAYRCFVVAYRHKRIDRKAQHFGLERLDIADS